MYVSVGLATLTKGPMAIALPGLVVLLYLVVYRELSRVTEMMLLQGILIVAAIVVPWYYALYQRDGWTYITSFLLGENVARFTDGVGVNARRGVFFYIPVVFSDGFPWSLLLPASAVWWLVDRREPGVAASPHYRVQTLLWLWIVVIVGFFTLSEAKQDLYIFPIVPAVAALGAMALARAVSEVRTSRPAALVRWTAALIGFLLVVVGGGVAYVFPVGALDGSTSAVYLDGTAALAAVAIGGGVAALSAAVARRTAMALTLTGVTLGVANLLIVVRVLPSFEAYKPVPGLSRVLGQRAGPEDAIATYNVAVPSLVYYLRRHIEMAYDPALIVELLESQGRAFVVLPDRDYDAVRGQVRGQTCVVSTHPSFDMKLRNVLAREPLPRLLLITNRCEGGQAP
jgi:4-amino-4-deoxy-L-arabinose transferase-like glycosyltransferase